MIKWDEHKINAIIAMHKNGVSTGVMAKTMGISRNAVIGKSHRLGLTRRDVLRPKITINSLNLQPRDIILKSCQYILNDNMAKPVLCHEPVLFKSAYCQTHHQNCLTKPTKLLGECL